MILRKCGLLFLCGVLAVGVGVGVGAAPSGPLIKVADQPLEDAVAVARKQRDLVLCVSTTNGYGFCDESLFGLQNYQYTQQPVYYDASAVANTQQPAYYDPVVTHTQYTYPDHYNSGSLPSNPVTNPQSIFTDQFVVIVPPNESTIQSSSVAHDQAIDQLFERLFNILEDLKKEQGKDQTITEEKNEPQKPAIHYDQLEKIFSKINEVNKNVTKVILGTVYLQQQSKESTILPGEKDIPDFDQIENVFLNLGQVAKNITEIVAELNQKKNESTVENTAPAENPSSQVEVDLKPLNQTVNDLAEKVDDFQKNNEEKNDAGSTTTTPLNTTIEDVLNATENVSQEPGHILDEIGAKTGEEIQDSEPVPEFQQEDSEVSPPEDFKTYFQSVITKIDELPAKPEKNPSKVEFTSQKKDLNESNDTELIHRLLEDIYDLAEESVDPSSLEKLSQDAEERTIEEIVESKFSHEENYQEVVALDKNLDDFANEIYGLFGKTVTAEDLSKTFQGGSDVTPEEITRFKDMTNVLTRDVPMEKIQDLTAKVENLYKDGKTISDSDFLKEKNEIIDAVKETSDDSRKNIFGERKLRDSLNDFKETVSFLYEKGVTPELIDNLVKEITDRTGYAITEILDHVDHTTTNKEKRQVKEKEETIFAELYDIIDTVIKMDYDDASMDAYVGKVDELTSRGVSLQTISDITGNVITDIVEKQNMQKRDVKDIVHIQKNDLYDAVEEAYNNNFTNFSLDAYFNKVDQLVRNGVEPFQILSNTLSNILFLLFKEIQEMAKIERKVDNNKLYNVIEEAIKSNVSESSMETFDKTIDELLEEGVDPVHLMIDVIGDLLLVLLREVRQKREVTEDASVEPYVNKEDETEAFDIFSEIILLFLKNSLDTRTTGTEFKTEKVDIFESNPGNFSKQQDELVNDIIAMIFNEIRLRRAV